jgi:hypothetical protein
VLEAMTLSLTSGEEFAPITHHPAHLCDKSKTRLHSSSTKSESMGDETVLFPASVCTRRHSPQSADIIICTLLTLLIQEQ